MRKRLLVILIITFLLVPTIAVTVFAAGKSDTRKGYDYYRSIYVYYYAYNRYYYKVNSITTKNKSLRRHYLRNNIRVYKTRTQRTYNYYSPRRLTTYIYYKVYPRYAYIRKYQGYVRGSFLRTTYKSTFWDQFSWFSPMPIYF